MRKIEGPIRAPKSNSFGDPITPRGNSATEIYLLAVDRLIARAIVYFLLRRDYSKVIEQARLFAELAEGRGA